MSAPALIDPETIRDTEVFVWLLDECRTALDRLGCKHIPASSLAEAVTGIKPLVLTTGNGRHRVLDGEKVWDVIPAPGFGPDEY